MNKLPAFTLVMTSLIAIPLVGCQQEAGTPVRTTLGDGQVLVGEVQTETLHLQTGMGLLEVPMADVGEVHPVEGGDINGSNGNVSVWLRDGTELMGKWIDPDLTIGIEVGADMVPVPLPVGDMYRFQMHGGEVWPEGQLYRVSTDWGDDFLVDPESTQLVIDSNLGTFTPFLSECLSASPVGDPSGDWRIELNTGTVLIGPLAEAEITFALHMGPSEITVPLAHFSGLERQIWVPQASAGVGDRFIEAVLSDTAGAGSYGSVAPDISAPSPTRKRSAEEFEDADGWFSHKVLRDEREYQYLK